MKIFSRIRLFIGILLVVVVTEISAYHAQKRGFEVEPRQSSNDMSLSDLSSFLENVPLIGTYLSSFVNYIMEGIDNLNHLSNGAISRFLGGMLPCVISRDEGIVCSGISDKGGIFGFVEDQINQIPDLILPQIAKHALIMAIKMFVNPLIDTLFGGVPVPST